MKINQSKLPTQEALYSFHSFIFPFQWQHNKRTDLVLEQQTELDTIDQLMAKQTAWKRHENWEQAASVLQYNEANYFYDFVRPVLYDTTNSTSIQRHYYHAQAASGECSYHIALANGKTYQLEVDDIVLSLYDSGVGILAFHLFNKEQSQSAPDDILNINNFGRRIYPPFFSSKIDLIGQQSFFDYKHWAEALEQTKAIGEIAQAIYLKHRDQIWISDDFSQWTKQQTLDQQPFLIRQLLPSELKGNLKMKPVLDDRMFSVCWYGNQALVEEIQGQQADQNYKQHDWWYQYVFVDKPEGKTCQSKSRAQNLISAATNDRWANYGTFYGSSRYSFVALTSHISNNSFGAIVCSHLQTIYYKIALLSLVQRASLLRFSEEITAISNLEKTDEKISKRIGSLYKQYIRFINKVYFREVTAQEQGIELYDMLQEQMRLGGQVKELEQEIQELYQYGLILEEDKRNEKLDILTYVAAFFVIPSFIATYLAIGDFDMKTHWLAVSILCVISAALAFATIKSKARTRWFFLLLTAIFTIYCLFIYPKTVF